MPIANKGNAGSRVTALNNKEVEMTALLSRTKSTLPLKTTSLSTLSSKAMPTLEASETKSTALLSRTKSTSLSSSPLHRTAVDEPPPKEAWLLAPGGPSFIIYKPAKLEEDAELAMLREARSAWEQDDVHKIHAVEAKIRTHALPPDTTDPSAMEIEIYRLRDELEKTIALHTSLLKRVCDPS